MRRPTRTLSIVVTSLSLLSALLVAVAAPANAAMTPTIDAVTAERGSTCALTTSGAAKCWGPNVNGELGDGTNTDASLPVDVIGQSSGVAAIDTGVATCTVSAGGAATCWGFNFYGGLGDGTNTDSDVPVGVVGLSSGVARISTGGYHTCALTTGGGVKCWGYNESGALGDGTNHSSSVPVDVVGLSRGVVALSSGGEHTCALTDTGGVKCWGYNESGALGDGTRTDSNVPVDVYGLSSGVAAISAGGIHTCALTTGGGVKCWGDNSNGALGDGSRTDSNVPVDVYGLSSGVAAISAGGGYACAVTDGGGVKCWGSNFWGELGDGTNTDRNVPVDVSGLSSGIGAIATGWDHTCALTIAGIVKCWGGNTHGELGDGTNTTSNVPVDVRWFRASLTLSASPDVVHYKDEVTLSVHLALPTYAETTNHWVDLAISPVGQPTVTSALSVDASGDGSLTLTLTRNTTFAATYAGDPVYAPVTTPVTAVGVTITVVDRALDDDSVSGRYHLYRYTSSCPTERSGCPTFEISTFPARRHRLIRVRWQVRVGGVWWNHPGSMILELNDQGRVRFVVPYRRTRIVGLKQRIRGLFAGGKFSISRGNWVYFRVTA